MGTRLLKRRVSLNNSLFAFLKNFIPSPSLLSPLFHPLSSLLSPMWQKLPYICNNFFHYSNLRITFLNYCTIEKSPFGLYVIMILKGFMPLQYL